jgi:pyruvate-formate lyase
MFLSRGAPLEVARDYGISACVLLTIPGKNTQSFTNNFADISPAKALELALFQGYDHIKKTQLGPHTPDPRTFTSFEELREAYLIQLRFALEKIARIGNIGAAINARYVPKPFISALTDGCVEKGKDRTCWAEPYGWQGIRTAGNINCANSLAAIKKLVFEEKKVTWDELLDALKTDFEGKEDLRQRLINEAPKFGNDDDYVDEIVAWVQHSLQGELENFKDYYGNGYKIEGSIGAGYFPFGRAALASADGRRAGEPFADGNHSPFPGTDYKGPTAVLKSMGKDSPTWSHLSNQKFASHFLEGENKKLFAAYLKTWADLGNSHIQFNVVDRQTLLDAQAQPEKYPDLMVRVAGYSAYFVHLHKAVQDDIIARTEQEF